jgi:autotransporter-associated beta strand protein
LWDAGGTMTTWTNATPNSAVFAGSAGDVTLAEPITAASLTFDTAGYALLGTGMAGHTLTAAGITLNANTTFGNSTTAANPVVRLAGDVTGTGTLTSLGAWLASDSTAPRQISTPLLIGAGDGIRAIRLGDTVNTGTLTLTGTVTTSGGGRGVEVMAGSTAVIQNGIGQAAAGNSITKGGAGTLVLGGSSTFTGSLAINSGVLEMTADGRLYNAAYNNSAVITISGGATWRIPNYSYAGMGQLADYRQRRVLDNGTIEVTANSHSSGQDFTVNAAGGTFRYTPAGQTLTLSGNTNTNIQFNGPLTFDTIGNISVTGASAILEGSGSLLKTGPGTLTLAAANTYSGATIANEGIIAVTNTLRNTSSITANIGATIQLGVTNMFVANHSTALGVGRVLTADGGTIIFTGAMDSRIGNLTLRNGGTITSNRGIAAWDVLLANTDSGPATVLVANTGGNTTPATMNGSGGIHLQGAQTFQIENVTGSPASDLVVSLILADGGNAGGIGALNKTGPGTLELTAANTYTGTTTVSEGTLALTGNGTVAGNLTVQPGALLDLSGRTEPWSPAANRTLSAGRTTAPATDLTGDLSLTPDRTLQLGGAGTAATLSHTGNLNLAGGMIQFDLGQTPAASDSIALAGGLAIEEFAGSVLNFQFIGEMVDAGVYPLISTTAGITGALADIIVQGLPTGAGGRQSFTLSTTTLPGTLTLDVTGQGAVLVWNNAAGTGQWNVTDANWNNNGSNDKFVPGDIVRLEDTANASETINLVGTLEPVSLTAANTAATTFILDGAGSLAGVTGLAASGGGTVVIRNANSFEGPLSITNASRVALENPAALRDDGTVSVTGGVLDIGATANVLAGTISLSPDGQITGTTGTLDALAINATGGTITADLTGDGSLTVAAGATLSFAASADRSGPTTTVAGSTLRLLDAAAFTGNATHAGALVGEAGTGSAAFTGTLSGGGLLRVESGTLILGGSQAYGGATTLNGGLLDLVTADARLYANTYYGGPVLAINSGATLRAARINYNAANHLGQLTHNSPNNVINGGMLDLVGTTDTSARGWTIGANGGTIRSAVGSTQTWAPNDEAWTQIDLTNGATLTFDVGGIFTLRSTIMDYTGVPGAVGGVSISSGGIVKTGPGLLDLGPLNLVAAGNAHRYTGPTTVSQGTLRLNSGLGTSSATVASGATLALGGTLPSYSCGGLTMAAGATLSGQIDSATATANQLAVTGSIDLGGATLDLTDLGSAPLAAGTKITLLTYTGSLAGNFAGLEEGASLSVGPNSFTIAYQDAGAVTLTATATTGYANWAATHAPTGGPADDFDGDGVPNAIEWVLGGTKNANDLAKLPAATTTGGNFVVSFTRAKASKTPDTTVRIQVGSTLAAWPLSFDVATAPEVTVTDIDAEWEKVTLSLTRSPDAAKFARLEVTVTP